MIRCRQFKIDPVNNFLTDTRQMTIEVTRQPASCGALIRGIELREDLSAAEVAAVRAAWPKHQVVAFPDQPMEITDIERFATYMGPNGEDPYIEAIAGHPRVVQVRREPDEKAPVFAETWHSDWSFLKRPPAATVLYGNIIPPTGGDTMFADQYAAWEGLPGSMKALLKDRMAVHSARKGYARDGMYGERDKGRSMAIKYGDSALKTQSHSIARSHRDRAPCALCQPGLYHRHRRAARRRSHPHPQGTLCAPGQTGVSISA